MTCRGDGDYLLGTHDDEIARLALQHRVWRPRVLDAWRRAGIGPGDRVIDIGAGPGFASLDLAEIVGPSGQVASLERAPRYVAALEEQVCTRGLDQISIHAVDLDADDLPALGADAAWCRWVLAFLTRPLRVVEWLGATLRPGGVIVAHEYIDYASWRLMPRSALFEQFVGCVIDSWREEGGDPDVGVNLPAWLSRAGFDSVSTRPYVDIASAGDEIWSWPAAFMSVGIERLVAIGRLDRDTARAMLDDFSQRAGDPVGRMVTPLVLEVVAVRR